MAVNRFWGQSQPAEYSPMFLQELAYAPSILYQREQDMNTNIDAMNQASSTLKSMLGSYAPKTEEFDSKIKNVMDRVAKEGATQQNMDALRGLRKTYASDIVPIEDYAKQREQKAAEYYKQSLDANNIIVGKNPLEITFEEFRSNPNSMQFQVANRSELMKHGMAIGAQHANSIINRTRDNFGSIKTQYGFQSAQEAMDAYHNDPGFNKWVEDQVSLATQASGLSHPSEAASEAIRSGIMTAVVGKAQFDRDYLYEAEISGRRGHNSQYSDVPPPAPFVDFDTAPISTGEDAEFLLSDPIIMAAANKVIREDSGKYGSMNWDDLNSEISRLQSIADTENSTYISSSGLFPVSSQNSNLYPYRNATAGNPTVSNNAELIRLKKIRADIVNRVTNSEELSSTTSVDLNRTNIGWYGTPEMKSTFKDAEEGLNSDISEMMSNMLDNSDDNRYGAVTNKQKEIVAKWVESNDPNKKMKFARVRSQYNPDTNTGSGQPTFVFELNHDASNKDKKGGGTVSLKLPPDLAAKALGLAQAISSFNPEASEKTSRIYGAALRYYRDVEEPYYNSKGK